MFDAPKRDPNAIATRANGAPAYCAAQPRLRQSAIDRGDKDALARLRELTGLVK